MITFTTTVKADQEDPLKFNFVDSIGNVAQVDGGIKDLTVDNGAEVLLDSEDLTGTTIICRSDISESATYPTSSTVRGTVDVDMGEGVKTLDIVGTIVTIPAEAVSANVVSQGARPRGTVA